MDSNFRISVLLLQPDKWKKGITVISLCAHGCRGTHAHTHERACYLWYDPNHGLYRKDDEHRGSDDGAALGVSWLRHKPL